MNLGARTHLFWPLLLITAALAAVFAAYFRIGPPLQAAIVFPFVLLCPGMALARLLPLRGELEAWVLAVALSLTLGILVALAMLIAGGWSPLGGLTSLAAVTLYGAVLQLARGPVQHRQRLGAQSR
ncbi:MAG: hypothetical protein H3C34_08455 [Caldilineaceae bacterium]|nr:hypothetical protein [Caldilineaceae bacterium]